MNVLSAIMLTTVLPTSEYPIAGICMVVNDSPEPVIVRPEIEFEVPETLIIA
jgi:hypothetical protein